MKRIFENNAYQERDWVKIIGEGVEKCEYDSTGTLSQNLAKFYSCVNEYLAENCVSFVQSPECDATEQFFEQCKNIQPNCTAWPMVLGHPESCCKTPLLVSEELSSKCSHTCRRKEFFLVKQIECLTNCTYMETGLRNEGKVDFEVVKKMLLESSNKTEAWEKPIEEAIQICEKNIKGEKALMKCS